MLKFGYQSLWSRTDSKKRAEEVSVPSVFRPRQAGASHPLSLRRIAANVGKDEGGGLLRFSLGKDGIPGGKGYEGKFRKPSSRDAPADIVSWR
jgi:hypothetical protein